MPFFIIDGHWTPINCVGKAFAVKITAYVSFAHRPRVTTQPLAFTAEGSLDLCLPCNGIGRLAQV